MTGEGYEPQNVLRKYSENDERGKKAFDTNAIQILETYPDAWERAFFTSIRFTPESEKALEDIATRIHQLADGLGIRLLVSGKESVTHATLQSGTFKSDSKAERDAVYQKIYDSDAGKEFLDAMRGQTVSFDYLILNPDSVTLNATQIPAAVKDFRDRVSAEAQELGAKSLAMDNFLHVTLVRITDLPENRREAITKFQEGILKLRQEIHEHPIVATVDRLSFGLNSNNGKES